MTDDRDDVDLEALWPAIRARIEASKVVTMPPGSPVTVPRRRPWWVLGAAAATIILVLAMPMWRGRPAAPDEAWSGAGGPELINAADSMRAYASEANELLNQLELQRAMLPPSTRASIDRDLRVIDDAIAEVRDALVRDPNNPALLRLLASSYRQKVELLKRAGGDG